jgi:hypothetical protein
MIKQASEKNIIVASFKQMPNFYSLLTVTFDISVINSVQFSFLSFVLSQLITVNKQQIVDCVIRIKSGISTSILFLRVICLHSEAKRSD